MAKSGKQPDDASGKGKGKEESVDSSQPEQERITLGKIQAMFSAAREKAANNPRLPADNGVPANVAMRALLDYDEERLREELLDGHLQEEARAKIRDQLRGIETQRRWLDFQGTLESTQTDPSHGPQSVSKPPSKTGKDPAR
ncbi:hypothetical protein VTI74DRAFT_3760 [Chaetomium olivicolor]